MSTEFYNRNWRMPKSSNSSKVSNYSMEFDGTEYIDCGNPTSLQITGSLSLSAWVKTSMSSTGFVISKDDGGNRCYALVVVMDGGVLRARFFIVKSYSLVNVTSNTINIGDNNYHHIVGVNDGTDLKIYVDGSLENSNAGAGGVIDNRSVNVDLGRRSDNNVFFNGKLDHVAIFDYALSSSQITSLYGNSTDGVGNPLSLSTKPVAYYKIGDKAAFNGSEYLVTNAASEVYSPYALDFDGTDDRIEIPPSTDFIYSNNDFSISTWFYKTNSFGARAIFSKGSAGNGNHLLLFFVNTTTLRADFYNSGATGDFSYSFTDNQWYHITLTRTSLGGVTLYVNGGAGETISPTYADGNISNSTAYIGKYWAQNTMNWVGQQSNFSIWNAALTSTQATEIYNEGKPSNLNNHSAYSNLVSWWQLGENMSYDGTKWTVLDEKGTNNGEGTNLGPAEDSIVNGVGTSANGLSDGMGGADNIVGDAPYSTANAVSYGMGVDALSTDVPS